jgi:hypothetical protein
MPAEQSVASLSFCDEVEMARKPPHPSSFTILPSAKKKKRKTEVGNCRKDEKG